MPPILVKVNDQEKILDVPPDMPLLWVLRDILGLTGTKYGCGIGACGSCTVHLDGKASRSCITPMADAADRHVITIEGLSADGHHPVQRAWVEEHVPQCGYCQPGQIMAAAALLMENPSPKDEDIDTAMAGTLCRCGTYQRIRSAIHRAAEEMFSRFGGWQSHPPNLETYFSEQFIYGYTLSRKGHGTMMNDKETISRRDFLKVSAAAGTGLVISVYLTGCRNGPSPQPPTAGPPTTPRPTLTPTTEPTIWFEPNLFVQIDNSGQVIVTASRMEMGQGVRTALAMILCEELEADWSSIQVKTAQADRKYGRQLTGGSESIDQLFMPLRQAGAMAREMLLAAAAHIWDVDPGECSARDGIVMHPESGRQLPYAELVNTAIDLPIPGSRDIALKDPRDFRLIGTPRGQIDGSAFVNGEAMYGMDVRLPDMRYAVIARPPVISGQGESFDASAALAIPGVQDVLALDGSVAVLADNTWAAIQGREALIISWDDGRLADASSEGERQQQVEKARRALAAVDAERLTAIYEMPYLAHATMEPMNCTADVRPDRCTIWVPTQNPRDAKNRAIALTRLPSEAVTVNVTLIGGGFGRRLEVDYVDEAVRLSQEVGAPVQVVWTREDDMRHDYYHPLNVIGCQEQPDRPDPASFQTYPASTSVRTGNWRAVTNIPDAFGHECFLDEVAAASGRDPYELRRDFLSERQKVVLDLAAEKAGWGTPLPAGWGRGIAFHSTWGASHVAQVAEVSVDANGAWRVQRVVCAIDCGLVINPDMVAAQMEGGIVFGLSALKGEIVVANGRVQQSNFHDYPILRMDEMPQIEVYIVASTEPPRGVGEMGTPPLLPAVANAIFAATGKRIRQLPYRPAA